MIQTPDQRVRVFVSSTLQELAPEREAARRAIEHLRLAPVMFELGARPHPPRELYRTYLEQSHVFIGIYGESYGWVGPDTEISGLEDEFRLAAPLPRLLYVKRQAADRDPRLSAMIAQLEADAEVSYRVFTDASELETLVENDLALLLSERFAAPPAGAASSLPAALDRFVGRTDELTELSVLLSDPACRLVTVTGPGGVGKTRLALEAARRAAPGLRSGVQLVALAPVADPGLVASTICERLGAPHGSRDPLTAAIDALRDAELLLVLDNFEHVLPAAADVERLLEGCAALRVIVTSRSVLKVRGERELRIAPLAETDAVDLFADRARAANRSFELMESRETIIELCRRLDGIPLAVELAAAQVRLLPPTQILERLGEAPAVHPSLQAAIERSFELLEDDVRNLCLRLAVFRGGVTLGAIEAVAGEGARGPLELLGALVESSLVHRLESAGEARYSMLETIRSHAVERLGELGALDAARNRHAAIFEELAQQAEMPLRRAGHERTLAALDRDADNVRAATEWLLVRGEGERVVAMVWALLPYLTFRERLSEGRSWLAEARRRGDPSPRALITEGALAFWASDYASAAPLLVEALGPAREDGDTEAAAIAEVMLGALETMSGSETGVERLENARRELAAVGNEWGDVIASIGIAWGLNAAEAEASRDLYESIVQKAREIGYEAETLATGALGRRLLLLDQPADAKRVLAQALERTTALRADVGTALYVDILADRAAAEGDDAKAVRLSAAAERGAESAGAFLPPLSGDRGARLELLRERLGEQDFEAALEEGRATSLDDAAAEARAFALAADRDRLDAGL